MLIVIMLQAYLSPPSRQIWSSHNNSGHKKR